MPFTSTAPAYVHIDSVIDDLIALRSECQHERRCRRQLEIESHKLRVLTEGLVIPGRRRPDLSEEVLALEIAINSEQWQLHRLLKSKCLEKADMRPFDALAANVRVAAITLCDTLDSSRRSHLEWALL